MLGRVVAFCSFAKEDSFHKAKLIHRAYRIRYRTPSGCYFCSDRIPATARFGGFFVRREQKNVTKRFFDRFTRHTEFAYRTPSGCYFCSDRIPATARFGGFFVRREQKM